MPSHLIAPYGGKLADPMVDTDRREELKRDSNDWPSWDLTLRQQPDLELLVNGACAPWRGSLTYKEYRGGAPAWGRPGGPTWAPCRRVASRFGLWQISLRGK